MDGIRMQYRTQDSVQTEEEKGQEAGRAGAVARIRELVERLREAGRAYYQESREIMSNLEYDRLYDELLCLEEKTGVDRKSVV